MKTNQIMISQDRELFGVLIRQETKTNMLNLSDLKEAYTHGRVLKGWNLKRIENVLESIDNHERLFHLLDKQGFVDVDFNEFSKQMVKSPAKALKSLGVYKTTGRGETKTTWCNPYVWVLIAMEMNPELYASVVTWLTDKLILNRIEAGNFYKGFTNSIIDWKPNYPKIAYALNQIVFGKHEIGIRNNANEEQLKQLTDIQKKLGFAVEMGYITDEKMLMEEMRKIYKFINK
jgi:hypothetical protein